MKLGDLQPGQKFTIVKPDVPEAEKYIRTYVKKLSKGWSEIKQPVGFYTIKWQWQNDMEVKLYKEKEWCKIENNTGKQLEIW
ncbi:MAG: hypothetical protein [Microviridae sp.]|nr:MAG: hypothetical protein [Microviridae sp.]